MGLKEVLRPSETIKFRDGEFNVRGLTPADITQLVRVHYEAASKAFDRFAGRDPNSLSLDDAGAMATDLFTEAPALVAHAIALAADEPDQFDKAMMLPLDVQVIAIEQIAILTFRAEGGVKNFGETVLRIVKTVNGLKEASPT